MKSIKGRLISTLLAGALLFSLVSPAYAENGALEKETPVQTASESSAVGSITATLRFDYAQSVETVQAREINIELLSGGTSIGVAKLGTLTTEDFLLGGYPATLTLKNTAGIPVTTETEAGYLELQVSDLPLGVYELAFRGTGYQSCTIPEIKLQDFSQHVVLGTSDVFLLGDVNGDNTVNVDDVTHLKTVLESPWSNQGTDAYCDLNGDGKLDVSDLAYVTRQATATVEMAEIRNTTLIDPAQLVSIPTEEIKVTDGSIDTLFQGGSAVTFAPTDSSDTSKIDIPLDFGEVPFSMQQLQLVTPTVNGAVKAGKAIVVYVDDALQEHTEYIDFGEEIPEDVHLLTRSGTENTITIDLGKRLPVKKITISVSKVIGEDGTVSFAVVEQIKFLQDIVPETPVAPNSKVRSVVAHPSNESVTLKWQELPNVTGYRVDNTAAEDGKLVPPVTVNTDTAKITGLKNLVAYTFTVTPINDNGDQEWIGTASEPIIAVPQPSSVPNPPDFLTIEERNGALLLSWGKTDSANYYQVFYKASDEDAFVQWSGNLTDTQVLLTDLRNDVEYTLFVKAGNDIGLSGQSRHVVGTPKAVDYREPAGIPADGRISASLISDIKLTSPINVSPGEHPNGCDMRGVADGDYKTYWTSQSYGDGNWSLTKEIQFTFKEPQDLSSVVYVPRLDGTYRNNLRIYSITVWDSQGNKSVLVTNASVRNSPESTGFAVLPFAPAKDVKRIDVSIVQKAYTAVSLSEIIFLAYDPARDLDAQIAALFTDEARTKLASGVTQADIDQLSQSLSSQESYFLYPDAMKDELKLATELLTSGSAGRILTGVDSRGGGAVNQGQGGSLLQPLGVAALANQQITVYASGIPEGSTVQLIATQTYAEANAWSAPVAVLTNGRNVVIIPKIGSQNTQRGGSLYLTYSGSGAENITLHVRRATTIPMLDLSDSKLTESEQRTRITNYLTALNAYKSTGVAFNATEISFPSALLSIPADKAKEALSAVGVSDPVETLYQGMLAWNEFMETAYRTQGIDDSSNIEVRQNVRNMQMFGNAFMYAAGSHVGVGPGSCGALLLGKPTSITGNKTNKLFGWGIAHEVGHNMDKLGKAEITNNIYSLVMQTRDSGSNIQSSRLEEGDTYQRVFSKTAAGYPGSSSDGSVALAMYWQLHLAYDNGNENFWNTFFKAWKGLSSGASYEDRVALAATQATGYDMTEFFTRWGMRLSTETKATLSSYPKDSRAVWYLSDDSRRDRLLGGTPVSGSITATATLLPAEEGKVQNQVEITVNNSGITDSTRIQGYEILRNGKSVAFSTEESYVEVIGSANNIAYSYTVQAYDILGNKVGEVADAGQVRIAYDKTIDAVVQRTGSVFTAALEKTVAVSGVKVSLPAGSTSVLPTTGAFTVEVSEGGVVRTAKMGNFAQNDATKDTNTYIAYFTKPGANSSDTRIWTFDANSITFTDKDGVLPADAVVQFISYAGDDVGFYTSEEDLGPVGTLKTDFTYSDNGEQVVIPAGTVVVVGTYRGDPLYNTIRVNGEYVTSTVAADGTQADTSMNMPLPGYSLLFAELPKDGAVSDISDGFFLFVPDLEQMEGLLDGLSPAVSGDAHDCTLGDLMPARIQTEIWRTDTPDGSTGIARLTGSTLWLPAASYDSLPEIELKGDSSQ